MSSSTATRAALEHAMDARALNVEQSRLIFNPSIEVDSLAELPAALYRAGAPAHLVGDLIVLCRRILQSNVAEGECETELAGLFEAQLASIRRLPVAERLTAKAIARRLRDPLAVMLTPAADAVAYFRACCTVRDVIGAVPVEQLLAPAVRHELRGRKYALLAQLVAGPMLALEAA